MRAAALMDQPHKTQECRATFDNQTICATAFADNSLLLGDSAAGLQRLIDHATSGFNREYCVVLNNAKLHSGRPRRPAREEYL